MHRPPRLCRLLSTLAHKRTALGQASDYDKFVCAEISPEFYADLRAAVVKHMVHISDPRGYPKDFCSETQHAERSRPQYRRRQFDLHGAHVRVPLTKKYNGLSVQYITNQHIVPYNRGLLMLPGVKSWHCNEEVVANTVGNVKYLFYYTCKGEDRVVASIRPKRKFGASLRYAGPVPGDKTAPENADETIEHINTRTYGPESGSWDTLSLLEHKQSHKCCVCSVSHPGASPCPFSSVPRPFDWVFLAWLGAPALMWWWHSHRCGMDPF